MAKESVVDRLSLGGDVAWLKRYGSDRRALRLRAMDAAARRLRVIPLRAAPRHVGAGGREVEQRRLAELSRLDVHVPAILAQGEDCLLLSDMGRTLADCLRTATAAEAGALVARAVMAIAQVHERGGYLGAPVARNLTVDAGGRIGFLDFEEDPGDVMPLVQAQARDWLVFAAGVSRHVPFDEDELARILAAGLRRGDGAVRDEVDQSVRRLAFLRRLSSWIGGRAAGLGKALAGLQRALASYAGPALVVALLLDLVHDGDVELLVLLAGMMD